jgi:hypothetical protein
MIIFRGEASKNLWSWQEVGRKSADDPVSVVTGLVVIITRKIVLKRSGRRIYHRVCLTVQTTTNDSSCIGKMR